jgi:hypothetical protein
MKEYRYIVIGGLITGILILILFFSQIPVKPANSIKPASNDSHGTASLSSWEINQYPSVSDSPRVIQNDDRNRSFSLDIYLYNSNHTLLRQENKWIPSGVGNVTDIMSHEVNGTYFLKFIINENASWEFQVDTVSNYMFVIHPDDRISREISGFIS